jgi:hypothetical protein
MKSAKRCGRCRHNLPNPLGLNLGTRPRCKFHGGLSTGPRRALTTEEREGADRADDRGHYGSVQQPRLGTPRIGTTAIKFHERAPDVPPLQIARRSCPDLTVG